MGEIERVANTPRLGDVVKLRGGYVSYEVRNVDNFTVTVKRNEVFREPPYERSEDGLMLYRAAWRDLVLLGASTVETPVSQTTVLHLGGA